MDSDLISLLVFVAISALSALSNWLQKRKQATEESELWPPAPVEAPPVPRRAPPVAQPGRATPAPVSTPRTAPAPAPSRKSDWEAELRRMLEGMEKPTAPPPVIVIPPVPTPPPPVVTSAPPAAPAPVLARRVSPRVPEPLYAEATEEGPESSRRLAVLHESAEAHAKATHLHEGLAMRMRQFDRLAEDRATRRLESMDRREEASIEAISARQWLGERSGLRQAMIATIVLGPPRSAEI